MSFLIDIIIVLVVLLYAVDGYRQGFIHLFLDILGIVVSFIAALKFYPAAGNILVSWGINPNLAKPLGFFALWTLIQLLFYIIAFFIFRYTEIGLSHNRINKILGIIPGFIKGVSIVAIFLIILMILPLSRSTKDIFNTSFIAGHMISATANVENRMEEVLGKINNTLTFIGTTPEKDGITWLNFTTNDFTIDEADENKMIELVNKERVKNNLQPLLFDPLLRNVARAHSADMLRNGYFAHQDLAGKTPFDRMVESNVSFMTAGENLALAPTVDIAHVGLMNSEKHRENILDPDFGKIGIGIYDAGPYGLMVTQEFTN